MAIKKFGKNQKPTTKQSNIKPDVLSDTWKKIKDRPSLIFYSLLIDGLFLLVAYIMSYAFNEMIVPNLGDRLPWRLAYLICLVAAYTILKFILVVAPRWFEAREASLKFWVMPMVSLKLKCRPLKFAKLTKTRGRQSVKFLILNIISLISVKLVVLVGRE